MANTSIPHQSVSWETLKSKDSSLQEIRDNLMQLNVVLLFSHNDGDSSASSCYPSSSSSSEVETTSTASGLLSLDELKALVSCGFHHFTQFDVVLCLLGVFLQQKKQGILKKRGKNLYRESGVYRYAIKVLTAQCPHEVFALVLGLMRYEGSSPVQHEDVQQHLGHEHYHPETFCDSELIAEDFEETGAVETWAPLATSLTLDDKYRVILEETLRHYLSIIPNLTEEAASALTLRLATLLNEDKFNKREFDCFRDAICPTPGFFFQKLLDEQKGIDDSIKKGKIQTIRLEILKITGTNLAPKDRNGSSDPFIQAHWEQIPVVVEDAWEEGKKKHKQKARKGELSSLLWKSEVKKRTLNPFWDFRDHPVGFDMHAPFSSNFTLLLQFWDADLITKDFLGSVRLTFVPERTLECASKKPGGFTVHYSLSPFEKTGGKHHEHIRGYISILYRTLVI